MELMVLNRDFESFYYIDNFKSIIWTDRYSGYGDFKLIVPATSGILEKLQEDLYLQLGSSNDLMIIEDIIVNTDLNGEIYAEVTGRSLESILDRRIIWSMTSLNGNFQNSVERLLNENAISPSDSNRAIPNLIFKRTEQSDITKLSYDVQFTGDNLYTAIKEMCEYHDIGFQIQRNSDGKLEFSLYTGVNRSYNQDINTYVVFSPTFENLLSSRYEKKKSTYKTITRVGGEGQDDVRKYEVTSIAKAPINGLDRREIFTDARDVQSKVDDRVLPDSEYRSLLRDRGMKNLNENSYSQTFEGEAEATRMYIYGRDFFIGDIVQIRNEFGMEMVVRVTEFIQSQDTGAISSYPTFTALADQEIST